MNSLERVQATLGGRPADRVPFTFQANLLGARLAGCALPDYYTDPRVFLRVQTMLRERFKPDLLFAPFMLCHSAAAFGSELKYFDDQPPGIKRLVVRSVADIAKCTPPDIDTHPALLYIRRSLKGLVKAFGGEAAIGAAVLGPVDLPLMMMGMERWLPMVVEGGDDLNRVFDLTVPHFVEWANALFDDGARVLVLPSPFVTPRVMTRELVRNIALPVLRDAFARVKGPLVLHHTGGKFLEFLDLLSDLPRVTGFIIDAGDDLMEARKRVGPGKTIFSGIDNQNMDRYSPGEVERRALEKLHRMRNDPNFVLVVTGPDIPAQTSPDNLLAMLRAVEKSGSGKALHHGKIVAVACSIFENEIKHLLKEQEMPVDFHFLDSKLHMKPRELEKRMTEAIAEKRRQGYEKIMLIYGDCHHGMHELSGDDLVRVAGHNCCKIIVGPEDYKKMKREKAFLLMPEWAERWKEVFRDELGLDGTIAPSFMQEMHSKLVFLDTGLTPVPEKALIEFSEYCGLPWEVRRVSPERLLQNIRASLDQLMDQGNGYDGNLS